jgi:2-polyprenyl-6-methoxyphenol hydroxylase-like FAD-dependent oxidoreductase
MMTPTKTTVAIAGAGPVGMTAALVLARAGVEVDVFEMRGETNQASRASTFHPPTLSILDRMGVFDAMAPIAQRVDRVQFRRPGEVIGELPFELLARLTDKPFRMHFEQSRLTVLMRAELERLPAARLHFGHEVADLVPLEDGVRVLLRTAAGEHTVDARFLIACDGARSRVREALGIGFEGQHYPGMALRVRTDAAIETVLPGLAPLTYLVEDPESASFLRMPDCWRVILRVPAGIDEATCSQPRWYDARLAALVPDLSAIPGVIGTDCYRAGRFVASRLRQGSVILAGDSAHITNTRGGMNMNCGIHDAWVFAHAIIKSLSTGEPSAIEAAAQTRHRIIREQLLPRTDGMVSRQGSWLERVRSMIHDADAARRYLSEAAMLDMVTID